MYHRNHRTDSYELLMKRYLLRLNIAYLIKVWTHYIHYYTFSAENTFFKYFLEIIFRNELLNTGSGIDMKGITISLTLFVSANILLCFTKFLYSYNYVLRKFFKIFNKFWISEFPENQYKNLSLFVCYKQRGHKRINVRTLSQQWPVFKVIKNTTNLRLLIESYFLLNFPSNVSYYYWIFSLIGVGFFS